jgi:signal transduction histidine kinase
MLRRQSGSAVVLASGVTVSGSIAVSGLAGAIAGGTALWSFRVLAGGSNRVHEDLLRPFAVVQIVIALGAMGLPVAAGPLRAGVISVVPLLTFLVAFVPWNVFAFRYAGRGDLLTRWRVLTVGSLVAVLLVVYVSVAAGFLQPSQESYSSVLLAASTLLLGLVAITFVSSGLALTAAYRHDTVPVASGVTVVFPIAILVVGIQVVSLSNVLTRELLASLHFLGAAAALPVAIARYDVLTTRPGTPRLGERTVIEDLNEAVLVFDTAGAIVRSNRQAERLFGVDLNGRDVEGVVGADVGTLREVSTLECWTDQGYKRLDPRVSTVRTGHDRTVGETVTLIDVTDREMLRQRVQVLNRILRHNIRNDLDVIRSHAEFALRHGNEDREATRADESVERILEVTDQVTRLSADARRIERLTRNSSADQSLVDVPQLVTEVVEAVTQDRPDVSVTVQVPTIELSINRELFRFALRNLVNNAVEHNDSPSPSVEVRGIERESGIRLLISDNGPGIPDAEWQVIEAGREEVHDHATSLGLWATKWTVQTMGGELSRRDTESGATVVINLPERSPVENG